MCSAVAVLDVECVRVGEVAACVWEIVNEKSMEEGEVLTFC